MSNNRELADLISQAGGTSEGVLAGRRNLIINGAMQVWQRGTTQSATSDNGFFTADRWKITTSGTATRTFSQTTDAPDDFSNSYRVETATSDTVLDSGDYTILQYNIEGLNLQGLAYGTSSAKATTLSFWIKSNMTGNVTVTSEINKGPPYLGQDFTINSADTWEKKTLTYIGNTTQAIDNDSTSGIELQFWLAAGDNFTGGTYNNTSWHSVSSDRIKSGNININAASGNYVQITGVQLELGSVATPFEHRSYGEELALCQRYYETSGVGNAGNYEHQRIASNSAYSYTHPPVRYKVTKRATPSVTIYGPGGTAGTINLNGASSTYTAVYQNGTDQFSIFKSIPSGYLDYFFEFDWTADAEL